MSHSAPQWDISIRLVHWSFLPILIAQWLLAENTEALQNFLLEKNILFDAMLWHGRLGFVLMGLIIYRVLWGFIGTETARFSNFLRAPSTVKNYAATLFSRQSHHYAGHNPLGGWMVVVLLSFLSAQVFSGFFLSDDVAFEGPLYAHAAETTVETMEEWHELNFNVLCAVVLLHISAILFYRFYKKQNLLLAMHSSAPPPEPHRNTRLKISRLLFCVMLSLLAVYSISHTYW